MEQVNEENQGVGKWPSWWSVRCKVLMRFHVMVLCFQY